MPHDESLFLVLGAGYVGRHLLASSPNALGTHRQQAYLGPTDIFFDLAKPETWDNVEAANRHVVWTFPATPLELVEQFYATKLKQAASLIVLGSTSAYTVSMPDERITEETLLDFSQPRVVGEEWLRSQGATILHLAGIFGPDREPRRWLENGLIKNGRKKVNLIHVADIVDVMQAFARNPRPACRLNVSNGQAPLWKELVKRFQERGWLAPAFSLPEVEPGLENKIVDTGALQRLFPSREWRTP